MALARALAIEPQVLLLDEPLSALDAKIRVQLREQIRTIQRQLGITTIYVTHDQEEALSLSDRIVVMSEGRIEQIGTPAQIYNFPATTFVAKFVGSLNVVTAKTVDGAAGTVTIDGLPVRTVTPFQAAAGSDVVLALRPEVVTIVGDGDAASTRTANRLHAAVDEVTFLGAVVRTRVKLPGGRPSTSTPSTIPTPSCRPLARPSRSASPPRAAWSSPTRTRGGPPATAGRPVTTTRAVGTGRTGPSTTTGSERPSPARRAAVPRGDTAGAGAATLGPWIAGTRCSQAVEGMSLACHLQGIGGMVAKGWPLGSTSNGASVTGASVAPAVPLPKSSDGPAMADRMSTTATATPAMATVTRRRLRAAPPAEVPAGVTRPRPR